MAKFYLVPVIILAGLSLVKSDEALRPKGIEASSQNQKISKTFSEDSGRKVECPSEKKDLCLILALSKIAKVQVANPTSEIESRISRARTIDSHHAINYFNTQVKPDFDRPQSRPVHGQNVNDAFQQNNVHCRAIRDIYIPEVHQKLPAFACKYGDRTFVLSSERFLEDRRPSLDITLDENSFQNTQFPGKFTRSSDFSVIPALLVLRAGENNYKIRPREDIMK